MARAQTGLKGLRPHDWGTWPGTGLVMVRVGTSHSIVAAGGGAAVAADIAADDGIAVEVGTVPTAVAAAVVVDVGMVAMAGVVDRVDMVDMTVVTADHVAPVVDNTVGRDYLVGEVWVTNKGHYHYQMTKGHAVGDGARATNRPRRSARPKGCERPRATAMWGAKGGPKGPTRPRPGRRLRGWG
jgi:hypothetical protein